MMNRSRIVSALGLFFVVTSYTGSNNGGMLFRPHTPAPVTIKSPATTKAPKKRIRPVTYHTVEWQGKKITAAYAVADSNKKVPLLPPCRPPKMPLKPLNKNGPMRMLTVVLDAGHGGWDRGMYWIEYIDGVPVIFYEAEYTYAMLIEATWLLRQQGATVYWTTYSQLSAEAASEEEEDPNVPLPFPADATTIQDHKVIDTCKYGWSARLKLANTLYYRKNGRKLVYIALHVDELSGGPIWTGGHLVVKDSNCPPKAAQELGKVLKAPENRAECLRSKAGQPWPTYDDKRTGLALFRGGVNPEEFFWETYLPQNPKDSLDLRTRSKRVERIQKVLIAGLLNYVKTQ